jgi:hypothetical protein
VFRAAGDFVVATPRGLFRLVAGLPRRSAKPRYGAQCRSRRRLSGAGSVAAWAAGLRPRSARSRARLSFVELWVARLLIGAGKRIGPGVNWYACVFDRVEFSLAVTLGPDRRTRRHYGRTRLSARETARTSEPSDRSCRMPVAGNCWRWSVIRDRVSYLVIGDQPHNPVRGLKRGCRRCERQTRQDHSPSTYNKRRNLSSGVAGWQTGRSSQDAATVRCGRDVRSSGWVRLRRPAR